MDSRSAISILGKSGVLLVFPIGNQKQPASLWSHFHPRKKMRWEWDEGGDDGVARLWHLRSELSTTRKVVYTKWFRGRATFFSRPAFVATLRGLNPSENPLEGLSAEARGLLAILEGESPLSTKELKRQSGLKGREHERAYERALRELWSRLLIVAFGEVDDGAFPSLAVGATRVLFEELWSRALTLDPREADSRLRAILTAESPFYRHFQKLRRESGRTSSSAARAGSGGRRKIPSEVRFEEL